MGEPVGLTRKRKKNNEHHMVKDGRGSILVNNKDLMDSIARGIFGDDEELGLGLAHLN